MKPESNKNYRRKSIVQCHTSRKRKSNASDFVKQSTQFSQFYRRKGFLIVVFFITSTRMLSETNGSLGNSLLLRIPLYDQCSDFKLSSFKLILMRLVISLVSFCLLGALQFQEYLPEDEPKPGWDMRPQVGMIYCDLWLGRSGL